MADQISDPQPAGNDENDAGHEGGRDEAVITVLGDHPVDHDDEGAGRPADLHAAAAERRDDEAGDDGGDEADARFRPRRDGDGDRQRQRDQRNGQAGKNVGKELGAIVGFQRRQDLRLKQGRARRLCGSVRMHGEIRQQG